MKTIKYRVAHFPQIPCNEFIVEVKDIYEGKKIMDILANYDIFQFENNIKPDYCNMQDFQYFDEERKEWITWYDDETGCGISEYFDYTEANKNKPLELINDGEFGKCPLCGYEFNSELISEYNIKYCPNCGMRMMHV